MDPAIQQAVSKSLSHTSLHPIFTKDPEDWIKLLNCEVQVTTDDGHVHTGCVYTVDPVSESIVLITNLDGRSIEATPSISLKLLVGAAVTDVKVISKLPDRVQQSLNCLFQPEVDKTLNGEDIAARKLKLKSWLERHRLPVDVGGDNGQYLTIADALTIQPPYTENSCLSSNEIILARIQGLIKSMPSDVS